MITNLDPNCILSKTMGKILPGDWSQILYDEGYEAGHSKRFDEEREFSQSLTDEDFESEDPLPTFTPKSNERLDHNESTFLGFYGFIDGYNHTPKRDYRVIG